LATISDAFPYESQFVDVLGSRMHYVEQGMGDPILFLHGNPTSSYLWRNIIPYASPHGRAIGVDMIDMRLSGKPDLDYRFFDHAEYLDGFIEALGFRGLTLVVHDRGSGLGFNYEHRVRVRGERPPLHPGRAARSDRRGTLGLAQPHRLKRR
jgi:haloalkane dehalogenase